MSYTKYSVHDLGADFSPWNLNNNRDVVGTQKSATGDWDWVPAIHLANGTVITLPHEIVWASQINNNGLVLGRLDTGQSVVFDITTQIMEPIIIPGFSNLAPMAINDNGDIVGAAGRSQSLLDDWRGFILNRKTQAITWVFPTIAPLPPGATPFLELTDLNNLGHAAGSQGWVRGFEQLEVPVFYNGNVVTAIGDPVFIANGFRITNTDRMHVWYHPVTSQDFDAIYDGRTNTLTPFPNGRIIDLNALGEVLWENPWSSNGINIDTTQLNHLLPAGSGWSVTSAIRMNDHGDIIGRGSVSGELHGYILTADYHIKDIDGVVAQILWGIINDAGGVEIIGGRGRRVPPYGPLRELLDALPSEMRQELIAAIDQAQFNSRSGVQTFSSVARGIVEGRRYN
jgi:hypothetical protein